MSRQRTEQIANATAVERKSTPEFRNFRILGAIRSLFAAILCKRSKGLVTRLPLCVAWIMLSLDQTPRCVSQNMTPADVNLVKESYAWVKPISEAAAELFYERLFSIAPEVRPAIQGRH
jgi:hypothetical protein